ncbi:MAG: MoxR family ATPase [Chloroflexota bacterium]
MNISDYYQRLREEADKSIVGLEEPFMQLVIAIFSGGHVLLEGVPGTAKTLMAKTLAYLIDADFSRVQFTPDLMPSDIIGTNVFNLTTSTFELKKGPVFTNILLADEINRAPAKTQSALLEAMEERQVNLDGKRYPLGIPFMVVATQNPIEYEGTYPLPEAQLDRFMFKTLVPYSSIEVEEKVLKRYHQGFDPHNLEASGMQKVVSANEFVEIRKLIDQVTVEDGVLSYITKIISASRESQDLILGASIRAATYLLLGSKTYAAIQGRSYVTPDDIKLLVPPIFRHRILLKPEAEIEGLDADAITQRILGRVEVPR